VDFGQLSQNELEQELLEYYEAEHPGCNPLMFAWKVAELLKVIGDARPGVILDAGCGMGEILRAIVGQLGAQTALGVEWSSPMLRYAAQVDFGDTDCAWLRANVNRLPVRADAVDLLMGVDIVEHVTDPALFLREARRVSRELAVKIPLGGRLRPWRRNFGHLHRFTLAGCRNMLREAGWEIVREGFPAQPVLPKEGKGAVYNALYVARRRLNQWLRKVLRRPRWYLAYARRAR